jgi:hypothetical protein
VTATLEVQALAAYLHRVTRELNRGLRSHELSVVRRAWRLGSKPSALAYRLRRAERIDAGTDASPTQPGAAL